MFVAISHQLLKKQIESGLVLAQQQSNKYGNPTPQGLYASVKYCQGDVIHIMTGTLTKTPNKQSIHIGDNMHVVDNYGRYINHSFNPNIKVVGNKLVALRDIQPFEEIMFNYNESEIIWLVLLKMKGNKFVVKKRHKIVLNLNIHK